MFERDPLDPDYRRQERDEEPGKRGGLFRNALLIAAGGLLFGVVAGAVMVGIQVASMDFFGDLYSVVHVESERSAFEDLSPAPAEPGLPMEEDLQQWSDEGFNGYATPSVPMMDVSAIVEEAMPSVVAITSTVEYQANNYGFGWFFGYGSGGSQTYEVPSSGSGIIVGENDTELLIVTNNHVVEDSKNLKVAFIDDTVLDAAIKGTDSDSDLAVLAVVLENIPDETREKISIAALGDSDELKVGQGVIAIGNALGYGQSVTVGYVSALNREIHTDDNTVRVLLQTDAAINPGNSGGALLNMKGEVIGINAAKYADTDVEGIGYAIPISQAKDILGQLMARKTREAVDEENRGYLGIQGTTVEEEHAKNFDMPQGVYVYKILENGAAAGTELREKDIITRVDGQTVKSMTALQELLAYYAVGEQVELTVQSQEGGVYREHVVTITLAKMPQVQD